MKTHMTARGACAHRRAKKRLAHLQLTAVSIAIGVSTLGCATNIAKHSDAVTMTPASSQAPGRVIRLTSKVVTSLRSGFRMRSLKPDSLWQAVGRLPAGEVYRPVGAILMARTGNAHEAYIVIEESNFVGVYLPVERVYVHARQPLTISFQEQPQ